MYVLIIYKIKRIIKYTRGLDRHASSIFYVKYLLRYCHCKSRCCWQLQDRHEQNLMFFYPIVTDPYNSEHCFMISFPLQLSQVENIKTVTCILILSRIRFTFLNMSKLFFVNMLLTTGNRKSHVPITEQFPFIVLKRVLSVSHELLGS